MVTTILRHLISYHLQANLQYPVVPVIRLHKRLPGGPTTTCQTRPDVLLVS